MSTNPSPLEGLNVLLVEDDPFSLVLMNEFLELEGAIATNVTGQQEGQNALEQIKFDLILCTVPLKQEVGYSLIIWLRQQETELNLSLTPAVAITNSELDTDPARILSAGFQAYLFKPYNFSLLIQTITKVLHERKS